MQPKEMGLPTTAYYPKEQIREVTGVTPYHASTVTHAVSASSLQMYWAACLADQ